MIVILMKNIFNIKELEKNLITILKIGKEYFQQEHGLRLLESIIVYLSTTELQPEKVIETIKEVSEKGGELAMTMATVLMDRGKVKWKKEGKTEGLKEGIQLALEIKFGDECILAMNMINKIDDPEKLELIKDLIKSAKNVNELIDNL